MSARLAAGWALSRSQSVSVVPMIQCRPHGMTNSTLFSVRRISPVRGVDPVARHDEVDALGRPDVELAAPADHLLDLVGPDAGGVDRPAGPGPRTRAPVSRSRTRDAGDPLALAQEADHPGAGGAPARRSAAAVRASIIGVPGVVDLGVVVLDRADAARPCAGRERLAASACRLRCRCTVAAATPRPAPIAS